MNMVNVDTSRCLVFHFCEIFSFWAVGGGGGGGGGGGQKGLKMPKMKNNNYIQYVSYLRNSVTHDQAFWYTCVK